MATAVFPGYDTKNGCTNSCVYKALKSLCYTYVLDKPLSEQFNIMKNVTDVICHSYGYWVFVVGLAEGLFPQVASVTVIDGYIPKDRSWCGIEYEVKIPNSIKQKYFFPTVGDRFGYPLEAIVRQAKATAPSPCIWIFRGIGFGHNLIYENFQEEQVKELVEDIHNHKDQSPRERLVMFPLTKIYLMEF